jgi:hypothetical protein
MTDKIMGAFEDLLQTYQQNYLSFRLTGNAANKTAYETAQQSINRYLDQLRASAQSNSDYVTGFLQDYAKTQSDIAKSQKVLQNAKMEGPKLQDDFTRQKMMEQELPPDNTTFYVKAGVVGAVAAVIVVVAFM